MKKILHFLSFAALAVICSSVAQAGHPLIQNGWLKSATDTSIPIMLPPAGAKEATFNFAPNVKITFNGGAAGTPADLQKLATTMGKTRILMNMRRDKPESLTVVLVGIKADKPAAPAPAPAQAGTDSEPAKPSSEAAPAEPSVEKTAETPEETPAE
jgi:hypothetical protein